MGKRSDRRKRAKATSAKVASKSTASRKNPEQRIKSLLKQHKYEDAINLHRGLDEATRQTLPFSDADLWFQQGRYECQNGHYKKAVTSLQKAIQLNAQLDNANNDKSKGNGDDDPLYWLAKALIGQQKYSEALEQIESAFNDQTLDKNLGGCYLKLLLLNDQGDRVQTILDTPKLSKRFFAPQLHWARGILALQSEKFNGKDGALTHFKKLKDGITPGDNVSVWTAYTHQQAGNEDKATDLLLAPFSRFSIFSPMSITPSHPAMQRLAIVQAIATNRSLPESIRLDDSAPSTEKDAALVWELVALLEESRVHDAAHIFLDLPSSITETYPETAQLQKSLMILAGADAIRSHEPDCTIEFWQHALDSSTFDPQLAVRLHLLLRELEEEEDIQELLPRLIKWVKQDSKDNPDKWPKERLNGVLAKLDCYLMDSYVNTGQYQDVARLLRTVEKLAPNDPDVMGRKGLEAISQGKTSKGITLLTKSLEGGCDYPPVYFMLLEYLDNEDQVDDIRSKYGKRFDDAIVETDEPKLPEWVNALLIGDYNLMAQYVDEIGGRSPALDAIQVLIDSAHDEPSTGHKITLDSETAAARWDELLKRHPSDVQVSILQAIVLVVQNHAKRNKKGIKALQDRYQNQLMALAKTLPEADIAHKALLVIRSSSSENTMAAVRSTVSRAVNPGKTLAAIQQKARWFKVRFPLRSYIDELLKKDSQNPHLLLAKATTYSDREPEFQTFKDQGFELARRLQDSDALQAFREEDAYLAQTATSRVFKGMGGFDLDRMDPAQLMRKMIREMFGEDIPASMIEAMLPDLMAKMGAEMGGGFGPPGFGPPGFGPPGFGPPGFGDPFGDDDDDEEGFFFSFPPPGRSKKKKKKKKKGIGF